MSVPFRILQSFAFVALLALILTGCSKQEAGANVGGSDAPKGIVVTSSAFTEGNPVPPGKIPPEITWSSAPPGTKSIVLAVLDPDASNFPHWLIANLPPDATRVVDGGVQGQNGSGDTGYYPPEPPPGPPHHYHFKVLALDTMLNLQPKFTVEELDRAVRGHIVSQGELVGTYQTKS